MTSRHPKSSRPSDRDLDRPVVIGASRGSTRAHATPDDIEDSLGANTIEGDTGNDTNPQGGIDKRTARAAGPKTRP